MGRTNDEGADVGCDREMDNTTIPKPTKVKPSSQIFFTRFSFRLLNRKTNKRL